MMSSDIAPPFEKIPPQRRGRGGDPPPLRRPWEGVHQHHTAVNTPILPVTPPAQQKLPVAVRIFHVRLGHTRSSRVAHADTMDAKPIWRQRDDPVQRVRRELGNIDDTGPFMTWCRAMIQSCSASIGEEKTTESADRKGRQTVYRELNL
jgi:hypothetical protein